MDNLDPLTSVVNFSFISKIYHFHRNIRNLITFVEAIRLIICQVCVLFDTIAVGCRCVVDVAGARFKLE